MAVSSKSTTMVRKSKDNDYKDIPTVDDVYQRHMQMKAWYSARDMLIRQYIRMHELQSPFGMDKAGMQDGAVVTATGDVEFDVATFPFDILSLIMSSMDNLHPQAHCQPRGSQTDDQAHKFEMLLNAVLDMRMQRDNFIKKLIQRGAATGWFVLFHPYVNELNDEGEFPFDIRVMNPLGVYPQIDPFGRPIWVSFERRLTGAQLKEAYGDYPGVAEMFEDEPDTSTMDRWELARYRGNKNNILTSDFTIIEYYDAGVRCILLNCNSVTPYAAQKNPTLAKYRDQAIKGKMQSVLVGSEYGEDNPYAGVLYHNLGGVPFSFDWCWYELRDNQSGYDGDNGDAGRYFGLPFLFSQYSNWRNISRILSAFHSAMIRNMNPPYITNSDVTDVNTAIVKVNTGEEFNLMPMPQISAEAIQFMKALQDELDKAGVAPSAYGAEAGTSGSQQSQSYQAGSVRMDTLRVSAERVTAKALTAIGRAMIAQGDETFSVYGNGEKYNGPYKLEYNIKGMKFPPAVDVKLMSNDPFADPQTVLEFKSLTGIVPQVELYAKLLKIPNPQKMIDQLRDELVMKNDQNMAPYVQYGALKTQNDLFKKTTQEAWKLQQNQDEANLWMKKEQAQLDASQVEAENMVTQLQAQTQQRTLPPPPPPGQGGPNPPTLGPSSPIPGPGGPSSMPPNLNIPGGPMSGAPGLPPNLNGMPPNLNMPQNGPGIPLPQAPTNLPSNLNMGGVSAGGGASPNPGAVPLPSVAGLIQRQPDDRGQPLQKMGRDQGQGLTNPGLNTRLIGPNSLPGNLPVSPRLQAANAALTEPSLQTQVMKKRKPRRARSGR